MRKFLWFLLGLLILVAVLLWWYLRQHQQKKIEIPVARQDTLPVKVPASVFRLPISFALKDLQAFLNQKIAGEFLETTLSPTGNNKDEVKVEMSRVGTIGLSAQGKKMVIQFPLQVKASIVQSRMRFVTKGIKPVVTSVVLTLKTPASLDAQWQLVTKFDLASVQWVQSPVVTVAGIKFDLTKKCDEAIQQNKQRLTSLLDTEINKAVSLREPVGKIWEDLQKPIVIVKKPAPVYLRFICQEIGGEFSVNARDLVCYTSIKAGVAIVSKTNMRAAVVPLPAFKSKARTAELSDAYVYAFAEFDAINEELQRSLQGMTFSEKGVAASIQQVQVYATDSGLAVQAAVRGDIDGDLVATGMPVFDSVTQQFQLQRFQFQLSSSSRLLNAGEAMMHDRIRDSIQSKLMVGLDSQIVRIPSIIEKAISKGKTGRSINVDVGHFRIASCTVEVGAKRIHLVVHALFSGAIRLKHLNAGKAIRIVPGAKKKWDAKAAE